MRRFVALLILLAAFGAWIGVSSAQNAPAPLKPSIILVSFDGFRWDYTNKAPTPNLRSLAMRGVRADGLIPSYPSKTFPNHYTIATGLYPGHHGIVANNILDPETGLGPYEDLPYARVEEVAGLIGSAGLKAKPLPDLRPAQWSKLIFNAAVNAVAALTGLPHDGHFADEDEPGDLGHLVHDLIEEGKRVAAAAGIELHEDPWEMNVLATRRGSAHYPSMLEDVEARRPTEIDLITGSLISEAERLGVPVPLHTAVYRLVKAKEASW